ncbi:hypothetical protein [Burkholderia sp. BE17]|uniref:hypothetical protein n=1 Tax=Burkholderia sp. BE17 TaxID=2656644 RepID=UPI00128B568F|nr:hypothetical protein [Burkholderia sp. BE17]MPV70485.1 hypothetical protein [Burkholderia sp. BE17]
MADISRYGPAVRCFLSPFDALLEMRFMRQNDPDAVNGVVRSNLLPIGIFYSSRFRQRPLAVHLAWLAHHQRLVAHNDGQLIRVVRDQAPQWRMQPRSPERMEIDSETWAVLDRLHERAGLFAWRDTLQIVQQWFANPVAAESTLQRTVTALDTIESIVVPVGRAEQVAVFDPESGQWHFVPRDTIN